MIYSINVTETAKQDIVEIAIWIAEKSGDKEIAKRFIAELQMEINKLDTFPDAGAYPKDRVLLSAEFRFTVYKEYLIFYTIEDKTKTVNIMSVFNAKKDYMRVLQKFI